MRLNNALLLLVAVLPLAGLSTPVEAHPHIIAEARLDVVLTPDQKAVKSLRHLWRFDAEFSQTVLTEFDRNADRKLDDSELKEIADTISTSIAEHGHFQSVTANNKNVPMNAPSELFANFDDNRLIVLFESEPATPIFLSGKIDVGVYDPTFYTAIEFTDDANITVEGLPTNCIRSVIRPNPEEAMAENQDTSGEALLDAPPIDDLGKIVATRVELTCTP